MALLSLFLPLPRLRTLVALAAFAAVVGCADSGPPPETIRLDPARAALLADSIRQATPVQVANGLELSLWAFDSLAPDPIALAFDDRGRAYITRTNRQKNSEFDIRGYRHWMTPSNTWETVEDRRAFLRRTFAPESSAVNDWLPDLNDDSLHDWRDLAVETEEVYRIEDTSGDGVADLATLYIRDFHDEVTDVAGAVLPFEGDVYVGVAPDLWRLRDTDGDGAAEEKTSISHGYAVHIGFSGHGMSGLTVGPDGRIYWSIGDIGFDVTGPDGKRWAYPHEGGIFRANPDGSDFEVFAHGVRNTHEFVFDQYGNLISVDNDGDHQGETERIVYLVNGSDSGWRSHWQYGKYTDPDNNEYKVWMDEGLYRPRFEGQAAYILPPVASYHSGPAGMAYEPGTALDERWRGRFFVAEFTGSPARSHIYAFDLEPEGAGFAFAGEEQVTAGLLATGLDFGPDGALYVADWLEGWDTKNKGRIWKLDTPEGATDMRAATQELLGSDFGAFDAARLGELLQHPDMRVRLKAQFELARQDDEETLLAAARQTAHQLARLHGLWGFTQVVRSGDASADALTAFLTDADPEVRAQAAKMLGDVRHAPAADALIPLLADDEARVRFFATEALGRIGHAPAVDPILAMLEANDDADVVLRHGGAIALARIGRAEPLVALAGHPSRALRLAAVVALRRLGDPGVARFLEDEDELVVTEAARAINDDASIEAAMPALARLLEDPPFTNEALIRRAINANHRLGSEEAAARVAAYAARSGMNETLRVEAVASLGVWPGPSVLDRVDGRYRGPESRDPAVVHDALEPVVNDLLADRSVVVRAEAASAVGRLAYGPALEQVAGLARRDPSPEVRAAALEGLAAAAYGEMEPVVRAALSDRDAEVRMTALSLVPSLDLPPDRKADLLASVVDEGAVEEQQAALEALGRLRTPEARAVLGAQLDRLGEGAVRPAIQLDVMDAVEADGDAALMARLEAYRADRPADDLVAAYSEALAGGDARAGARVFFRHEAAQCVRCHAVGDFGSAGVGPNLMHIGETLTREQLLEALVDPSARIAPGFGSETVTLSDGSTVSGVVRDETGTHLVLVGADGQDRRIALAGVTARASAPSSMPPMGGILTRRELRDVVAYLAELDGSPVARR